MKIEPQAQEFIDTTPELEKYLNRAIYLDLALQPEKWSEPMSGNWRGYSNYRLKDKHRIICQYDRHNLTITNMKHRDDNPYDDLPPKKKGRRKKSR